MFLICICEAPSPLTNVTQFDAYRTKWATVAPKARSSAWSCCWAELKSTLRRRSSSEVEELARAHRQLQGGLAD
eukprot:1820893-Pleurochrysis_carterae.AAC.1